MSPSTSPVWERRLLNALQPDPIEEMRMIFVVNARNKFSSLSPKGYYGNGLVLPTIVATAGALSRNPIGYALELVKKVKADMMEK